MSWAEVTKINSDLSVPLNEKIDNIVESRINTVPTQKLVIGTNATSSLETVLDISGSGLLHYALFNLVMNHSNAREIKIVIDGNIVYDVVIVASTTSSTSYYTTYGVWNSNYPTITVSDDDYSYSRVQAYPDIVYTTSNSLLSSETQTCDRMSSGKYCGAVMQKDLVFNESLKISINTGTTSSTYTTQYGILYSLLD